MNICPGCNTIIKKTGAKFCPKCGKPVNCAQKQKPKTVWIIAGVAAFVLLIAGIALVVRFLPFLKPAYAAVIAPAETDLFFTINPDLKQVKNFNHIKEIYESIPEVKRVLDDLKDELKGEAAIDIEKDVKPWLGKEAALIVPDSFSLTHESSPSFIIAVASANKKKTEAFMEKVRQGKERRGASFEEKNYRGVKVTVEKESSSPLVYALVKDFLILSKDENLVCQTIDRIKDKNKQSLSNSEDYKEVMNKLPKSRSGALYLDFQDIARVITDDNRQFQQLSWLKAYKGMGVSLSFADEGVRLDYALAYDSKKMPAGSQDTARSPSDLKKAREIVPSNAIAYLGFPNFKKNVEDFLSEAKSQPAFDDFNEELYDFERDSGISLERDILSWMKGEVAVGIFSDRNGFFDEAMFPLGYVALFVAGDPQAAESKMRKITDVLAREGLRVSDETLNGQEIHYLFSSYQETSIGGYGIRDGYLVIGYSRQILENVLGGGKEVLANSAAFKKATANLPSPQGNLIYLDVEKGVNLVSNTIFEYDRREFDQGVYPFLKPVKSIILASQEMKSRDNFLTGAVFINIER